MTTYSALQSCWKQGSCRVQLCRHSICASCSIGTKTYAPNVLPLTSDECTSLHYSALIAAMADDVAAAIAESVAFGK
jgi:hypothetical protein